MHHVHPLLKFLLIEKFKRSIYRINGLLSHKLTRTVNPAWLEKLFNYTVFKECIFSYLFKILIKERVSLRDQKSTKIDENDNLIAV